MFAQRENPTDFQDGIAFLLRTLVRKNEKRNSNVSEFADQGFNRKSSEYPSSLQFRISFSVRKQDVTNGDKKVKEDSVEIIDLAI